MSDPNKLEVEISVGSTGEIQALTKAIDGLSVSFKSLDAINTGGILEEFRTLATSMKGLETSMNGLSSTLVSKMQGAMLDVKKAATKGGKEVTAALTEGMGDAAKAVGDALKGAEQAAVMAGKNINKKLKKSLEEEEVVKQVKVTVTSKAINLGNGLKAVPRQSGAEDLSAMRETVKALQEQAGVNDLVAQSVKNLTKNSTFANKSLEEQLKTARLVREISKVEGMTAKQLTDDYGTKAVWASRNLVRVEEKIAAQEAIKLAESVAAAKKAEDISTYKSKLGVLNAQIKDASAKAAEEVAIVEASERAKAAAVARSNLIRVNQATQAAKGELSYPSGAYSLLDGSNVGTVKNAVSSADTLAKRLKALGAESGAMWARLEADANKGAEASARNLAKVAAAAKVQFNQALPEAGTYSVSGGTDVGAIRNGVSATNELTAAKGRLRKEMNELHSAARGLASGFGAMWLTWGSIVPLMAGAAVSTAFVQTLKMGAEVQESLTRLKVLGGESAEAVAGLNAQMLELARTGPFGPREVAEAMKTLTLAGLSAAEVSGSIKDVLNFSLAGDVGIKDAADALTTIATAFGVTAQGFNYVSDTISKAAAESKSSVESMASAFKTAAVINQQYGVTIEETAVGLSLLANAGIKGTSAGTALKNMYADLSGRTKHVRDALKELGVTAFDPLTGKMRETGAVFKEMLQALETKNTPDGGRKILGRIFGERGEKEAFAIIEALRTKAKETSTDVGNAYDELLNKVTNAAGFAAVAAAEISLSPLNQMKSVTATLQSVLVETFTSLQPYLLETSARLKEIFNSDQFKGALQSLVTMVGSLVTTALEHGKAIASVLLSYMGLRAAIGFVGGMGLAMAALTTSASGAAVAVTSVGVAARVATAANPLLLALSAAVTAAAVGWSMYQLWKGKSDQTVSDGSASHGEHLKALQAEAQRLENINTARERGITLQALELELNGKKTVGEQVTVVSRAREAAAASAKALQVEEESKIPRQLVLAALKDKAGKDELALQQAVTRLDGQQRDLAAETQRIQMASGKAAVAQRLLAAEEKAKNSARFTGAGTGDAPEKGAKDKLVAVKEHHDKELELIRGRYTSELSVIREAESGKHKLLTANREALIMGAAEYRAKDLAVTSEAERAQLAVIEAKAAEYQTAYTKRFQGAKDALDEWRSKNSSMAGSKGYTDAEAEKVKALEAELSGLSQTYDEFFAGQNDAKAKIENGAMVRMQMQAISARGEINKLDKVAREFWRGEAESAAKQSRQTALEDSLRYASPQAQEWLKATSAEQERLNSLILEQTHSIDELSKSADYYANLTGPRTEAEALLEADVVEQLRKKLALRKELQGAAPDKVDEAGRRAVEKFTKDEEATLVKSVAGAVETALFEGGKAGSKSLRKIITDQLKKPISMMIQAVVQPLMAAGMGALGIGTASAAGSAAGGAAGSVMSGVGGAASLFGAGGLAGSLAAGAGWLTGATTLGGSLAAGASLIGTGTLAGGMAGAGMIVGALGPIAIGIAALVAIAKATEGETRTGGQYGYSFNGATVADPYKGGVQTANGVGATFLQGPSGGDYAGSAVRTAINATVTGTNKLLGQLGSKATLTGFQAGYETSDNNRGGALAGGTLSTGATFGQSGGGSNYAGTMYDPTKGFNLDAKGAFEAFGLELQQATLEALQAAGDIPATVKRIISDGAKGEPISKLNATETAAMLDAVGKVTNEVETLKVLASALPLQSLKDLSFDAAAGLIAASGGLDKLTTNLGSFYQNFFTAEERNANLTTTTQRAFTSLGITMPAVGEGTDAWYRSLVQSKLALDQTIPANAEATAGVLALGGAVSELSAVSKVTKSLERELAVARGSITQRQAELQDRLAEATNDSQRALIRLIDTQTTWNDLLSSVDSDVTSAADETAKGVAEAAKKANDDMASAGDSIRDFLKEISGGAKDSVASMSKLREAYLQDLAGAQRGDLKSSQDIAGSGKAYLDAQIARSATLVDARRASAKMAAELRNLPATLAKKSEDSSSAAKPEDPLKKLVTETMKDLKKFMKDLYEAEVSANTRGLLTDAAEALYESINAVKNADLSVDLKLTATTTLQDLARTLSVAVTATYLDDATKGLVATAGTSLARAMTITVTSVHSEATRALGITALEATQRTLNLLISDKDMNSDLRKLALGAVNGFNGTVSLAFSTPGMSAEDIANAVNLVSVLTRTITIAVSSDTLTLEQKTMALMTAQTITKTVNFAITNLTGTDKDAVLAASGKVTRTLELSIANSDPLAIRFASLAGTSLNTIVSASNGVLTPEVRAMLAEGDLSKIIVFTARLDATKYNIDIEPLLVARGLTINAIVGDTKAVTDARTQLTQTQDIVLNALLVPGNTEQELRTLAAAQSVTYNAVLNAGAVPADLLKLSAAQTVELTAALRVGAATEARTALLTPAGVTLTATLDGDTAGKLRNALIAKADLDLTAKLGGTTEALRLKQEVVDSAIVALTASLNTTEATAVRNALLDNTTPLALKAVLNVPQAVTDAKTDLLTGGNLVITPVLDTTAATAYTDTITNLTTPVTQSITVATTYTYDYVNDPDKLTASGNGYGTGNGGSAFAKGGAFGTLTAFAKGGLPTNSVLNSPFFFNMGVAGEAGPEAIMPLKRGADGSLGVRADVTYQPAAIEAPRNQGDDVSSALLARLLQSNEAMRAELSLLRQSGQRTEKHTEASSKTLTNVTRGGDAMQVSGSTKGAVLVL